MEGLSRENGCGGAAVALGRDSGQGMGRERGMQQGIKWRPPRPCWRGGGIRQNKVETPVQHAGGDAAEFGTSPLPAAEVVASSAGWTEVGRKCLEIVKNDGKVWGLWSTRARAVRRNLLRHKLLRKTPFSIHERVDVVHLDAWSLVVTTRNTGLRSLRRGYHGAARKETVRPVLGQRGQLPPARRGTQPAALPHTAQSAYGSVQFHGLPPTGRGLPAASFIAARVAHPGILALGSGCSTPKMLPSASLA